jgi:2'-5' RNA ligase
MARLRTFIAVDIGKTIRERAVALQVQLGRTAVGVKWVEADNLHVTLLFLGEVDDRVVPSVCQVVAENAGQHASFTMSIEKAGCFPHPRRPRILWIGIGEGAQELRALHDGLEIPLLELGCYRREERLYTPHITLGRVKTDRPADMAMALARHAGWKGGQIPVRELLIMSSELTPKGPIYTVLSRAKLAEQ